MWKLWKSEKTNGHEMADELSIRLRAVEAELKAQTLEIDKLYSFVRSNAGRLDKKKALIDSHQQQQDLSPEQIVALARGKFS